MRIVEVNEEYIEFSNGKRITYDHDQDCCEHNYADFEQLDDLARNYEFGDELYFGSIEKQGFSFGDARRLFFVPCYSEQNGYYNDSIDVYYDGKRVIDGLVCEFVDC